MSEGKSDQSVYAAGQAREFLRNELADKENHWIREFAGLIDDEEVLDWLNYRCSLYRDHGKDFLDTRTAQIVIRSAATRSADRAFKEGSVSQLQGIVGLRQHQSDGKELYERVAERLSYEGSVGLVFGPPGAGKTASTLDSALAWLARTGGTLIGNTSSPIFERKVTTDEEMLEAMASIEGPVLAVLDEIAQDLSGFGEGNKDAESFSDSLLWIRKREERFGPFPKKGSVLLVAHTRKKTAASIRRVASFGVAKPNRSDPTKAKLLDSEGGRDTWEEVEEFSGLTDTGLDYEEYEPSEFRIVLNDEDGDDEPDVDPDDVRDDQQIATVIRACEGRGMSYKQAASLVDYSDTWVGERVREWRRGEHRDLVSEDEVAATDHE